MPRTQLPGTNRSDLVGKTKLPNTTAPGQQYGAATAQQQAQKLVPMGNGTQPPPAAIAQDQGNAASPPAPPMPGPATAAAPLPGQLPDLARPTDRPNEPVTTGAASGPGAGPEALMGFQPQGVAQTIAHIAQASGNADLMRLAQMAQAQGA